ncbi:type IX secretion system motor protein PorM/GldM [Flavihumibacter profundi]|uniref:type IX secretion system motor protein PorM/GldM n=1 Tax=Flavihumibacter profundi TaxID=2716883 RepID=UPI001CC41A03|nr:gliding motility protein GldM [Flavihumibacter profundi]MBZ5858057.1 gliding motility protein GldM [Flavihumibacter profundi]
MALPKEPRQKMINMMYLVLTALLALNVSSEILNAFKTVNTSINHANEVVDSKNKSTFNSFEAKLKDPKTAEKTAIWYPKAQQAQKLADAMTKYIEDLKTELKTESKGENIGKADEKFSEDNLDASTRMLVEGPKGEELRKKLEDYKNQMLAIVPEEKANFAKSFPLDLSIPESKTGTLNNDWKTAYFHMTPTIAALTILSKFQNDVKNSETQVVDYCHKEIGEVEVVFDEFQAFVGTNSTYLMPGQELEINAGVGAFSKAAKPTVTVNGSVVPLGAEGSALYKTTVSGAGEKSVNVVVNFTKPDGTPATLNKTIKYTVGVPSGASVFLEKMNVVYQGVDNPVMVSAGSAGKEKMNVSFTGGTITPAGGDRYIIKPTKTGPAELNITVEGKTTSFPMRCKTLPDPAAMVGASRGGSMPAATFKAMGGVLAKLMDSEFDAPFQVVGYTLGANGGAFQNYQQAANEGPRWGGTAATIVNRATPGTVVYFDQIRVKGPDGKVRELPGIFFNLK